MVGLESASKAGTAIGTGSDDTGPVPPDSAVSRVSLAEASRGLGGINSSGNSPSSEGVSVRIRGRVGVFVESASGTRIGLGLLGMEAFAACCRLAASAAFHTE
jgi:hypothetical protein